MTHESTITLERRTPKVARVTFANPPANLIVSETVTRLDEILRELEDDPDIQVLVFTSGVPDFFFNHFDLAAAGDFPVPQGEDAVPMWTDIVLRLSRAPTSRSRRSAVAPAAAATSSPSRSTCATRAGNRQFSASPRSAAACCRAAGERSDCPDSSDEIARSR